MTERISRGQPPYLQIANDLRRRIVSGELVPGDHLPSGREIAREWGCAYATATKVLTTLRKEGLAESYPGHATIVSRRQPINQPPDQAADAADEATAATQAAEDFIADLKHWREVRGLSQTRLAAEMTYDASYVSKIENAQQQPTHEFARRADEVLHAGGSLIRRCRDYTTTRSAPRTAQTAARPPSDDAGSLAHSLLVRHEEARCRFADGVYHMHTRRQLYNASDVPVTRYLIRIAVDRHPKTPEQSNELYRQRPLTWEEIGLRAWCEGEELRWEAKHDRDAFKEVWLLLENEHRKLPLYPGESTWLEYRYTVGADKWGQWFQRAIRLPTERLSVQLAFPAHLDPAVWGTESTMTAQAVPVRTAITQRDDGDQRIFDWSTDDPPLHARYRFEWRLTNADASSEDVRPSERMRRLGVVQADDPVVQADDPALRQPPSRSTSPPTTTSRAASVNC